MTLYPNLDYICGECGNPAYVLSNRMAPKRITLKCANMECPNYGELFQLEVQAMLAVPIAPASPANQG